MVKIFITVRNRLAITKKCIHAIKQHSKLKHSIYVYDNSTNHLLENHFAYFFKMYSLGHIDQVCFTSENSTFNAFSKASTCNFFGLQHEQDPQKDKYEFLVILDNDIIVTPDWDLNLRIGWKYIRSKKLNNIKVIGQLPGGIKGKGEVYKITEDMNGRTGKLGGSGLWSLTPNFFRDVGLLDLKRLVGHDKKHDQMYWQLLEKATGGKNYIMGLNKKLGIHCGKHAGSVCNVLTRNKDQKQRIEKMKFKEAEEKLNDIKFNKFFELIQDDKKLIGDW